ncbi:MAG: PCRF domain-containing protein, partial [Campylobacterota bacterium]
MLADKLTPFINRYNEITELLSSPDIGNDVKRMTDLSKEQSSLQAIFSKATEYKKLLADIEENKALVFDAELGELAKEELKSLEPQVEPLEEEIKKLLIPADPNDKRNIYIELRAGTGGDEAALFVGDLFNAYVRYADVKGWKIELMSSSPSDAGGYKEI